ncbi:MAG TPA: hypothetical protein VEH05_17845 [Streptosporangiaceae bacterium]|nr:hypothetical protein [Streptosporangiaceae bacterium]
MPGQRRTAGRRTRGSWLPRIAGIGVIVLVAAGGVAAYLVTLHPAGARSAALPTRVVSDQTVGLIVQHPQPRSAGQLVQLLGSHASPEFSPVSLAEQQSGSGQWTADLMAGNSYIFIFLPNGDCLGAAGRAGRARLVLQRCDLAANQRWRRVGPGTLALGHSFYAYANLADRSCLTEGGQLPGPVWGTDLSACARSAPPDQLVAFWWATG